MLPALTLTILEALLIGLAAVALARLGWALLTPAGPVGPPPSPSAQPAINPDALAAFDPFFRTAPSTGTVSTLELTLVGTRVDRASGRGSAIITLSDQTQSSFAVGDDIMPGVRLASVNFDFVTLDNNGTCEELFLDQSGPLVNNVRAATITPQSAILTPANNPSTSRPRLAADIQTEPRIANGRVTGIVLSPKGSGTAFGASGLEPGDMLTEIDGTPVASLGDLAAIIRRIDAGGVILVVERDGQRLAIRVASQAAGTAR